MDLQVPLFGRHVTLEPLAERHKQDLRACCDADPDTWNNLYPFPMHGEHFDERWRRVVGVTAGWSVPFAVIHRGEVVGLSGYISPDERNRCVEIGFTYYRPQARGGVVNPEAKRLLMAHAYALGFDRIEYKVDAINERSRAAVVKLGAVFEGILRHDRVVWTGRIRDTAVYSILAAEWPAVRDALDARIAAFGTA